MLDGAAEELETGRVEVVGPRPDALGPGELSIEAGRQGLARHEDDVGAGVDEVEVVGLLDERGDDLDAGRPGQGERLADVVRATPRGADEPDLRAGRQRRDLVDELHVSRADDHRDDRDAAGDERLGLVGVECRRGHEVVVEAFQPVRQVVEQRAFDLDRAPELVAQPFGVVARVGVGALGVQDPDERAWPLALGGGGERGRGELVGGEAGLCGPPQHLGDDARQRLGAAPLRRPFGDVRAGAVTTGDVARVGQTTIDRPDGIGVHSQGRPKLAHGRQPGPRQKATGVDLVGELPVDLGRDRDVRIALDIERPTGRRDHRSLVTI